MGSAKRTENTREVLSGEKKKRDEDRRHRTANSTYPMNDSTVKLGLTFADDRTARSVGNAATMRVVQRGGSLRMREKQMTVTCC
jgi:hypothetical protein